MEFQELLKSRRSVRVYEPRAVDSKLLEAVLTAATLAPSAGGLQTPEEPARRPLLKLVQWHGSQ